MGNHNYIPREAKIIERNSINPDSVSFKLKISNFSFHPGQFIMASVLGFGEVPIGITSSPTEKGTIEIAVRASGMVTKKICSLGVGDNIGVNGPFGNGFDLRALKGRDVILISGGIGLMPLRSLIKYLEKNKKFVKSLTLLNGSRSPEQLLYQDEYKAWSKFAQIESTVDTCNKDWAGCIGMVTELFDRIIIKPGTIMIVCGPPVMYKSVISRFAGKSISDKDLYFMLERNMKCGIGKCQHCTCGNLYACLDGPVFSYDQIKYNKEAL